MTVSIGLEEIEAARAAVDAVGARTPVFESRLLSERTGASVWVKAENLQRTGSFKWTFALLSDRTRSLGAGAA